MMGRLSDSSLPSNLTEKPHHETGELCVTPQPAKDTSESIVVNSDRNESEHKGKDGRKDDAETEQTASFANYFVCGSTFHGWPYLPLTCVQRVLSYTSAKDRIVLGIALICSIGSGVVCLFFLERIEVINLMVV